MNISQHIIWAGLAVCVAVGAVALLKPASVAPANLRLARIDSLKIKNTAEPFVKVRGWFERQCQNTQTDLTNKIHSLQKTYEWLKVTKKDEKGRTRHDAFRQEVAALEVTVQKRKDLLTQQFGVIQTFLEEKLKQVIAQLAHEKGISLVLNQYIQEVQALLFADDSVLDITPDVIRLMEQETQNLHLPELIADFEKEDLPQNERVSTP